MKKVLKGKILYFFSIFAILFGFVFAFIANSPNAYAAVDEEITSAKLGYNSKITSNDMYSLGNWSWNQSGVNEQSLAYSGSALSMTEERVFFMKLNSGGATVTFTYDNSSTKYKISRVDVYYKWTDYGAKSSISGKYGTTSVTPTENNNIATFTMGKTTDNISISFTGIDMDQRMSSLAIGYIKLYQEATKKPVTIAKGTGVKSVYLSTTQNAASGSASGTEFDIGATVYGFAELAKGYKAKTGWSLVSGTANTEGAIYCVGSVTAGSKNFDAISADFATYTITYNLNNGTVEGENPTSYDMNSADITLINPTRIGYTFKGWSGNDLTGDENKDVTIPTGSVGDRTYTANWTGNTYNVVLNKNGGTINGEEVTQYVVGEGAILPADVTKDNFVFIGWYDNEEFTGSPITEISDTDIDDKEYFARFAIVENDGKYFTTLADAIDKAHEGDVIKLLIDLNLSDSITILKSITIDLNGHILNIPYISSQTYTVWVSEKSTVTIDDSSSNVGGVKGTFGVQSGSYIALKHGRLDISKENILAKTNLYKVADNILLLNCNDGNPDEDGFLTLARLITDDDYANEVIALINVIGEVTYPDSKESIDAARKAYDGLTEEQKALVTNYATLQTAETNLANLKDKYYANEVIALIDTIGEVTYPDSKESIAAARKAYDKLTDEQKALVSNYATLQTAETNYATLEASNFEDRVAALPDASNLSLNDKDTVLAVEAVYDNLDEAPKALIKDTTVTRLNEIVAKLNELINCNHNLIKFEINEIVKTSGPRTSSSINYKNNDILPGSIGIDIGFIGAKNVRCATGYAIATATVNLEAARTIHFHWNAHAYAEYANIILKITPNDEEPRVYNYSGKIDYNWHIEEINCHAGLNTITFRYEVNQGSKNWEDQGGRHLWVLPEVISHFDENSKCDVCGVVCTHETIGMGYDETKDEYFFRCFDLCANKVDLNELSHENKSIVESARAAYDKLTDEQKGKVSKAVLDSLLQAEEDYNTYVNGINLTAASLVISKINNLPAVSSFTLDSKADVLEAREAYNALTTEQKALVSDELLTKLTTLESKIPVLEVEALINAIPALDEITADAKDAIDAARKAYNALSDTQKGEVSEEKLTKLTASEGKCNSLFADAVIALINSIPALDEITYDDEAAIKSARKSFDALTAAQKEFISQETLAKLTDSENKYNSLFADVVIALINALPDVNDLVFGDKSKIEQARAAYNSLTNDQRTLIASEYTTKLSKLETKLRELSWVDYSLPNGTYKFVSASDETKALVHIDNRTVRVGVYDDNNRHYKWKTVSWTNSPLHEIYNIFDPYANERLLDSNGWGLSDGNGIGFVGVGYTKSESETNLFRFSKHMGVIMEEDEYYIRIVKDTAYEYVLTLRSDTKVNIGAYSKGSLNQVWKVVRVKGDEDYAAEVEEKIKLLPESYDATTLDDEGIVNDAMEAYNNLTKYQKTLVSQARTKQLEDANQKIVDIKAANAFIQKMNAIGDVTYDKETLTRIHTARDAYNELTDNQKTLADDITILTNAESAYAALANASITSLLNTIGEVTLEDKDNVLEAKAKYDELSKEEKALIEKTTFDRLSAVLVSYHILALPKVGVLVLSDKTQVVAVREEYEALTEEGKALVSENILKVLVDAETEIKDIEAAKAVDDLINALPNLTNLTINHATAVSAARAAYEKLSDYQKGKVTKSCLDKLIVAEAIISVLGLPTFANLTLDDEAAVVNVNAIIKDLEEDQKALVPKAISDLLESLNTKIADMKAAKAVDDLIVAIGEVAYTDTSKGKIDNARLEYNAITEVQQTYVKHLDTLINAEAAYAALAEKEISDLLALKVEDITISDKEKISKAKGIYDSLTKEEKLHLSNEIIDKILASAVTLAVIDIHETSEITLADDKDKILTAKTLYNELTEEQQQTLVPEKIVNKYFAALAILEILELPDTTLITISNKDAIVAARATYTALTDAQKALVPQTVLDKLIATEAVLKIEELPVGADITQTDKDAIVAARATYTALTDAQKVLVPQTVLDKLIASEAVLKIVELPNCDKIAETDKDAIKAARATYTALTDAQKALVPQTVLDKLVTSEAVLKILLLPASGELTIGDKTIVEAARTAYTALDDEQKTKVAKSVLDKLIASEACLVILGLPAYDEIESSHATLVESARTTFDNLTDDQEALVAQSVLDKLIVSELVIKGLSIIPAADVDTNITQSDKEAIEKAYDMYSNLSKQQLELVPEAITNKILSSMAILSLITLPDLNTLTVANEETVDTAFSVYNQLTEAQKALMPENSVNNVYAANAIMAILKLHDSENLELTDEADIIAARALYDKLTDAQKALVPQARVDKLVASEAILEILELPVGADIKTTDKKAIEAARNTYQNLKSTQSALVPNSVKDTLVAAEITLKIVELPASSEITPNSRKAIEAARASYENVTNEQKAKVAKSTLDTLKAAEASLTIVELPASSEINPNSRTAIEAARAAYTALDDEQKAKVAKSVLDKLVASEAILAIVSLKDISEIDDTVSEEDKNAIKAAKSLYDKLTEDQLALLPQDTVDKILTLSTTIEAITLPKCENITLDNADEIKALKEKYDDLTDEEKKMISSDFVDKIYAADAIITVLELDDTDDISSDDKKAIEAAREVFDNLTEDQLALVPKNIVDALIASEAVLEIVELPDGADIKTTDKKAIEAARAAYKALDEDQEKLVPQARVDKLVASEAILEIVEIPVGADIKTTDKDAIVAARNTYENLKPTQSALVPNSVKDTLKAAETTLKIVELPASFEITPNSRPNIVSTRAAYENLTNEQKAKVAKSTLDTLIAAEASLTIVELPASSEITPNSRTAIEAARAAYEALDDEQKAKVAKSVLDKLVAAETTLTISELPKTTVISTDSKEDIEAARSAYDKLSEEQKALVPQEILDTLVTSEAILNIVELPIARDITADSKEDIEAARSAYDKLTDEQKANVQSSKLEKLTSSEATLKIVELPVVGDLTFEDKKAVLEAKNVYESLTPGAKESVPFTAYNKLEDALVEINDIEAAKDVSDMINDLPDISKITREDILDVNTSRNSYEELSDYQQGKVSDETLNKLEKIEEIYISMDKIDSIGTVAYKEESKTLIDDAKEYFDSLDSDQIKAIDNVDKLNKAFNDYYSVDDTVNKADSITNIRHDTRSDNSIKYARVKYESLSSDQKALLPKESLQKIVDGEAVYAALDKIYAIGDAQYTVESELAIAEARNAYSSLTEEQKALVNEEDVMVLESAEVSYTNKENSANVVFTVFIIIVVILLVLGAPLLVLMVITQLKSKKGSKAMSVAFIPVILATSHYLDSRYIVLYLLAALLIGVIIAITVIAIKNPNVFKDIIKLFKKEEKMEMAVATEASPTVQPIPTPVLEQAPQESEEDETIVVTDKEGNIFQIRFNKSFTAKLIQANDESKKYYEELKNYVLSFNKTTSRISWHYDSINSGRNPILKFAIRGKTLGVYFALDPEDYTDTKYKVEKVESKKYEDVPCLYRIKNDRRCEYAKDLIDTVMNNLGLVKDEEKHESYYYQYEENEPLIARGLIKELKVQVNKQEAEETQAPSVIENSEDEEEVIIKQDNEGNIFQIRYIKSFTAKLSQAEQVVKDYYNELKNYALSYNKTNSRVSWHYDSINIGRKQAIKFAIRGKVLCLYYALDANDYVDSKYKVEKVESKKYEDVPCLYRIKNDRRCKYAKDLIDTVMNNIPTEKGKESNEDFKVKYETTQALLEKGLIKELKTATTAKDTSIKSITVEKADELMSDEKAKASVQIETVQKTRIGSKEIINIDVLSNNFNDGDEVTIDALIEKNLVPSKTGYIKLLARGSLDKKLIVYVNDYSLQAVKMITLLGGQVKQIK